MLLIASEPIFIECPENCTRDIQVSKQSTTGKGLGKLTLRTKGSPKWCGSVHWALFCKAKCPQFDSQSEHMTRLWVRSPIGAHSD